MKYLKTYNESIGTELEEVQWCKDALQDLEDAGYKVSIRTYPVYGISSPGISITIDSNTGKLLPITIGEYLLTLHSYLLESGYVGFRPYDYDNPYSASRHQVTVNAQLKGVRNQFENELSQFVKMLDRFQVNAPFDSVSVSYYKPDKLEESSFFKGERNQLEEDKSYINDIFIPLITDDVLDCEVKREHLYRGQPTPQLVIIENKRRNTIRGRYLKFSDIKDELLHLRSYLDKRWVGCSVLFTSGCSTGKSPNERVDVYINENTYDSLDERFNTLRVNASGGHGIISIIVFFRV
jgi:hypothetical protein